VIIAVAERRTVVASGIGVPEYASVLTWYRWWCSICQVSAEHARASHPDGALSQGDHHLLAAECHTEGQLPLFPLAGAR
jgi:hypothetical protein